MICDHLIIRNPKEVRETAENLSLNVNDPNHREELKLEYAYTKATFRLKDLESFVVDGNYFGFHVIHINLYTGRQFTAKFEEDVINKLHYEINVR